MWKGRTESGLNEISGASQQLLRQHGAVRGHDLPPAILVHEHIRPSRLSADVLSLVGAFVIAAVGYDGRITVDLHLGIVERCGLEL